MQTSLVGNEAIGSGCMEVEDNDVGNNWDAMFAVTLRMHRRLDICRLCVPWMLYLFQATKQVEVGLGKFQVVLGELAMKCGG